LFYYKLPVIGRQIRFGYVFTCPLTRLESQTMTDTPPDRLSNNPTSPHYNADLLARGIGIRFAGAEKTNVEEYCVSEGWVRVAAGNAKDRRGNPLTIKLTGPVEPYFQDEKETGGA
jgi:hypothetical protein